jgi:aminocarboxymuconate-semialdehyde decarboxylase
MVGTDDPFVIMDRDPAQRVERLQLSAEHRQALRQDNAMRWLALA